MKKPAWFSRLLSNLNPQPQYSVVQESELEALQASVRTAHICFCEGIEKVEKFPDGERRFLGLVGYSSAFISDESLIRDFDLDAEQRARLSRAVGYIVHEDQLVWKVLRDLEK